MTQAELDALIAKKRGVAEPTAGASVPAGGGFDQAQLDGLIAAKRRQMAYVADLENLGRQAMADQPARLPSATGIPQILPPSATVPAPRNQMPTVEVTAKRPQANLLDAAYQTLGGPAGRKLLELAMAAPSKTGPQPNIGVQIALWPMKLAQLAGVHEVALEAYKRDVAMEASVAERYPVAGIIRSVITDPLVTSLPYFTPLAIPYAAAEAGLGERARQEARGETDNGAVYDAAMRNAATIAVLGRTGILHGGPVKSLVGISAIFGAQTAAQQNWRADPHQSLINTLTSIGSGLVMGMTGMALSQPTSRDWIKGRYDADEAMLKARSDVDIKAALKVGNVEMADALRERHLYDLGELNTARKFAMEHPGPAREEMQPVAIRHMANITAEHIKAVYDQRNANIEEAAARAQQGFSETPEQAAQRGYRLPAGATDRQVDIPRAVERTAEGSAMRPEDVGRELQARVAANEKALMDALENVPDIARDAIMSVPASGRVDTKAFAKSYNDAIEKAMGAGYRGGQRWQYELPEKLPEPTGKPVASGS